MAGEGAEYKGKIHRFCAVYRTVLCVKFDFDLYFLYTAVKSEEGKKYVKLYG